MRVLDVVVKQMMEQVPQDFENRDTLQARLDDRVDSSHYTAPELMWLRWQEVGEILGSELGEPDTDWKKKIVSIFADKE